MKDIRFEEYGITSSEIQKETDKNKLFDIKTQLNFHMISIAQQLEDYKVDYEERGISGDYSWFRAAKRKLKLYGVLHQVVQGRSKELKSIKAQESAKSFERHFVDIAKGYLRDSDFEEIKERVFEKMDTI